MVHLESRNIDQENKRIEIGCKGGFECVNLSVLQIFKNQII